MRDTIIVSVSELRSLVQDVRRSGKDWVELSIIDPLDDPDDGDTYPAMLELSAFDSDECIDFECIYAPENEAELSDSLNDLIHLSSNLL